MKVLGNEKKMEQIDREFSVGTEYEIIRTYLAKAKGMLEQMIRRDQDIPGKARDVKQHLDNAYKALLELTKLRLYQHELVEPDTPPPSQDPLVGRLLD